MTDYNDNEPPTEILMLPSEMIEAMNTRQQRDGLSYVAGEIQLMIRNGVPIKPITHWYIYEVQPKPEANRPDLNDSMLLVPDRLGYTSMGFVIAPNGDIYDGAADPGDHDQRCLARHAEYADGVEYMGQITVPHPTDDAHYN